MPNHIKHHVAPDKPKTYTDPNLYLFFALALFFTDCALFCPREFGMEYVVYSGYEQKISTVLVYVVAVIATHYQYKRNQFVEDKGYSRQRCFWLFIALLPLVVVQTNFVLLTIFGDLDSYGHVENLYEYGFFEVEDIDYFGEFPFKIGYWHKTAIWALFILTATCAPAIHQHRSDAGISGVLLLMADGCALVYLFFYFTLPAVSPVVLFIGAISFTVIAIMILVKLSSFQRVKQLARNMLFELAFWLNFISLVLVFVFFGHVIGMSHEQN
jgi:hypothetical protein